VWSRSRWTRRPAISSQSSSSPSPARARDRPSTRAATRSWPLSPRTASQSVNEGRPNGRPSSVASVPANPSARPAASGRGRGDPRQPSCSLIVRLGQSAGMTLERTRVLPLPTSAWTRRSARGCVYLVASALLPRRFTLSGHGPRKSIGSEAILVPRGGLDRCARPRHRPAPKRGGTARAAARVRTPRSRSGEQRANHGRARGRSLHDRDRSAAREGRLAGHGPSTASTEGGVT
jgi:hypothetical protein